MLPELVERMAALHGVEMDRQELRTGAIRWVSTDLQNPAVLPLTPGAESAVVKLYDGRRDFEHLLAVGAPLYRAREEKE